jgi:chemotaxis protein MotB
MRKKHPEHVNLERWLVSYADFITLLFAFFVVMYAISQADMAKFKAVSASMKAAFSGGSGGAIDLHGTSGGPTVNPFEQIEAPGGRVVDLPAGKTAVAADDTGLQNVRDLLEESISLDTGVADTSDKMQMQYDSRGLVVRLAAKDFFEQNDSQVRPDLRPLLDRIGRVVAKTNRLVRVEGHADPSESNPWELSMARAAWVVKYWISRFDVDPKRLAAAGLAQYRPLTDKNGKQDEWTRARNRRVEIIILNSSFESP